MKKEEIERIRTDLRNHIGYKVELSANQGRQRYETMEGILVEVYSYIFVVQVFSEHSKKKMQKMAFSYQDMAAGDVKMKLIK